MFYVAVRYELLLVGFLVSSAWEMAYIHVKAGIVAGVRVGNDHLFQSGGGIFGPVLEARVGGCRLGCGGKAQCRGGCLG